LASINLPVGAERGRAYSRVHQDGFTETGAGGADLAVKAQDLNAAESLVGVRLSRSIAASGGSFKLDARVHWAHELSDVTPGVGESFAAAAGTGFTLSGARLSTDHALTGVGLSYERSSHVTFFAGYDGDVSKSQTQNSVNLGARFTW
jgi:outer membrane autotransporter protein